ncbi:MAG: hypothetical protein ACN4GZ_06420 [Acidimicrobiales bacterium]
MQQTHSLPTRPRYPWELTDETRHIGRQGLARVRKILDAKIDGPAQQRLEFDLGSRTPVTTIGASRESATTTRTRKHTRLAA